MPAAGSVRAIRIIRRTLAWAALPLWGWAIAGAFTHLPPHGDALRVVLGMAITASVAWLHEGNVKLHETATDRDKDVLLRALAESVIRRGVRSTGPMRRAPGRHEASVQPRLSLLPARQESDRHAG